MNAARTTDTETLSTRDGACVDWQWAEGRVGPRCRRNMSCGATVPDLCPLSLEALLSTRDDAPDARPDVMEVIDRLREQARSESAASKMMADAKTARQTDREDAWTAKGYSWTAPEQTTSWKAADMLATLFQHPKGEVEAMREALEPFAAFADLSGAAYLPDDHTVTLGSGMAARQLTMGDCRKARKALAPKERSE